MGYNALERAPNETGFTALNAAQECLFRQTEVSGAVVVEFAANTDGPIAPALADATQRFEAGETPDPRESFAETVVEVAPTIDRGTTICQEKIGQIADRMFAPGEYAVFVFFQANSDSQGGTSPEIFEASSDGLERYDPTDDEERERLSLEDDPLEGTVATDTIAERLEEAQASSDDFLSYSLRHNQGQAVVVGGVAAVGGLGISWLRTPSRSE